MSPYSSEEVVTRAFLLHENTKGIINIVDATNIERNLYLCDELTWNLMFLWFLFLI